MSHPVEINSPSHEWPFFRTPALASFSAPQYHTHVLSPICESKSLHLSIPHGYGFLLSCARVRLQIIRNILGYVGIAWAILIVDTDHMYKLALLIIGSDVPLS